MQLDELSSFSQVCYSTTRHGIQVSLPILEVQRLSIDFSLSLQIYFLKALVSIMLSPMFMKVAVGAVVLCIIKVLLTRKRRPGPLPPGPSPKPLIGNILDLPSGGVQDWMHWVKHKEIYG